MESSQQEAPAIYKYKPTLKVNGQYLSKYILIEILSFAYSRNAIYKCLKLFSTNLKDLALHESFLIDHNSIESFYDKKFEIRVTNMK